MDRSVQRTAYGQALVALGDRDGRICVLDADLGKSTNGAMFKQAHPERYFEMGIAEQNMMSVAAGLALTGKVPFVNSFAAFVVGRAYDQFRQTISIGKLNVKVCGSSAGLSDYGDGSTHQSVEDLALMRAIPNVTVLSPADAVECAAAVEYMAQNEGPMYLRVNRNPLPALTPERPYDIRRMEALREGRDAVVFATGVMVSRALEAAEHLAAEGIEIKVVNVSTIKPLNRQAVIDHARGMRAVVTAEEHSIIGGLGSAVAEALRREGCPIEFVGLPDCFGTSARNYDQLLEHYQLTAQAIQAAVKTLL